MSALPNRKILLLILLWAAFTFAKAEANVDSRKPTINESETVAILSLVATSEATDIRKSFERNSDSRAICLVVRTLKQDQLRVVVESVKQVVSDVIEGPDCGQPCREDGEPWAFKCARLTVDKLQIETQNVVKVRVITGFHILEGAVKTIKLRKTTGHWKIISSRIDSVT